MTISYDTFNKISSSWVFIKPLKNKSFRTISSYIIIQNLKPIEKSLFDISTFFYEIFKTFFSPKKPATEKLFDALKLSNDVFNTFSLPIYALPKSFRNKSFGKVYSNTIIHDSKTDAAAKISLFDTILWCFQ